MDQLELGTKIREFRTQKGLSIKALAEQACITPSMLSQIERDLVNPSINTLKLISKVLGVPIFRFFKEDMAARDMIVRRDMRKTIGRPEHKDVMYDLLTPDTSGNIEFCLMRIPPDSDSADVSQTHSGEEVAYVDEGDVEITVAGECYELHAGDSIRIPQFTEHSWKNRTSQMVKVIFAISPPSF